jgi:hypothetical protein
MRRALGAAVLPIFTMAAGLAMGTSGCRSSSAGSPVLIGARWKLAERTVETLNVPDLVVAPDALRLELVFDRRLDGDKIEDGSQEVPQPRADPPVHVTFAGAPGSIPLTVVYASNATGGPAIWASPSKSEAFPAGKTLTFTLDRTHITSTDGTPFTGPQSLTVTTAPFSVDLLVPPPASARPSSLIPISFNNPPAPASVPGHVRVVDGRGVALPVTTYVDNRNRQLWNLEPACAGGWPAGAPLNVIVDGSVTDLYGAALGHEASAMFSVAPVDGAASGCVADGGVSDSGLVGDDAEATTSCTYADAGTSDDGGASSDELCSATGCGPGRVCVFWSGGPAEGGREHCVPIPEACHGTATCACMAPCVCTNGTTNRPATCQEGAGVISCNDGII